jgi:hypothetical protein
MRQHSSTKQCEFGAQSLFAFFVFFNNKHLLPPSNRLMAVLVMGCGEFSVRYELNLYVPFK